MLESASLTPRSVAAPARVLVAEDDRTASAICVRALSNAGFEPSVAFDGKAAWEMLRKGEFDLVVTDVFMPSMDGIELVRAMRADPRLTRLPVLVLTSSSEHEKRAEGYRVGCDGYLVKPIRPNDLIDGVSALLSRALGTGARMGSAYLQGRLDGMTVGSLLSFLHSQERSGMLRLWRFGAYGEIAMRQGQPLSATLGGSLKGEEALSALLGWNAGTFRFERYDVSELESELHGPFQQLIDRAQQRPQRT